MTRAKVAAEPREMTAEEYRAWVAKTMPEAVLLDRVVALARANGWLVHHCRPARMGSGRYATPIQGAAGFPDLVLVRDVVVFAELKRHGERPRPEQSAWLETLGLAGADARVWRPQDWDEIEALLSAPRRAK